MSLKKKKKRLLSLNNKVEYILYVSLLEIKEYSL